MSTETHRHDNSTPSRWGRRTRIAALAAALVATVNWCHPPTPDINIFHRTGGQQALPVEIAE